MSGLLHDVLHDLRYAFRTMRRTPGFSVVAAATIAVGISATTVVFSLIAALILNKLPVHDPDRLVIVDEIHRGGTERIMGATAFSFARYEAYRAASRDVFTDLAGHRISEGSLRIGDTAEVASVVAASANYFDVLGLRPAQGRFFAPDANRTSHPTAVISHELWTSRFGANPAAVGRRVHVDSKPHEIVGVAPRGFSGTVVGLPIDIWIPARAGDGSARSGDRITLFGRLRGDIAPPAAAAALDVVSRQVPPDRPGVSVVNVNPRPFTPIPSFARGPAIGFMTMLLATAGLVLLISSTNVAGMLLARASDRRRELAVRMAIGAGRRRLLRQLLTESVLLFLVGGGAGVLLTAWLVSLISTLQPPTPMRVALELSVDWRVLAFASAAALLTGLLAGTAPALQATRPDVAPGLRDGTRGGGRQRTRLRGAFVVVQLALSLLLVVAAGLFGRTLQKALTADVGFNPDGVVVAGVSPSAHGYDEARTRVLQAALLDRVRAMPGVEGAAFAVWAPMAGNDWRATIRRGSQAAGDEAYSASIATVGAGYMETLQIPLVAGRYFTTNDRGGAQPVALVNQTLAQQLWPGASPLGEHVRLGETAYEVIGVTTDGKYETYTEAPRPVLYLSLDQRPAASATLHVRSRMEPGAALAAVRRELAAIDPNIALEHAMPLSTLIGFSLYPQRLAATVIGIFGFTGLLVAAIGLYGVLAFHVSSRTREIGIRMALGAPVRGVIRMVLGDSLRLVVIGTAIGLFAALALSPLLRTLLYGITPTDPVTFAGGPLVLMAVALIASYVPARRAARVDPAAALRTE